MVQQFYFNENNWNNMDYSEALRHSSLMANGTSRCALGRELFRL